MKPRNMRSSFSIAREDPAITLEPAKQALDLIATLVHLAVDARLYRWHHWNETQIQCQLPCLVAFVGTVHQQMHRPAGRPKTAEQAPAFGCVVRLPRREAERHGRSSIRGNHMNLGVPSPSGFSDGLRTVFFNAPVPSGWTLMLVESSETASILMRTTCAHCNCSNMRSRTPALVQRFMRV